MSQETSQSWADSPGQLVTLLSCQPLDASCPPPPPREGAPGWLSNSLKKGGAVGVRSQDSGAGDGGPGPGMELWEGANSASCTAPQHSHSTPGSTLPPTQPSQNANVMMHFPFQATSPDPQ